MNVQSAVYKVFRVTYFVEVALANGEGVNLKCNGVIPFVPQKGTRIIAVKDDNHREVEQVYWDCENPDFLEVFFCFEEDVVSRRMKKLGWLSAD